MTYTWVFEDAAGTVVEPDGVPSSAFPTQADAEGWIGESWRELLDAGVDQVHLLEDGVELYGPMSLRPAE